MESFGSGRSLSPLQPTLPYSFCWVDVIDRYAATNRLRRFGLSRGNPVPAIEMGFPTGSTGLSMGIRTFIQGRRAWVRLHEKGGKRHDVPANHNLDGRNYPYHYPKPGQRGRGAHRLRQGMSQRPSHIDSAGGVDCGPTGRLADGKETAYALDQKRCADVAPRALCADQRRTGQIHRVVAHRFIAGAGRGGMNPQILSGPDLSTVRQLGRGGARCSSRHG